MLTMTLAVLGKNFGFLTFPGIIEMERPAKMG